MSTQPHDLSRGLSIFACLLDPAGARTLADPSSEDKAYVCSDIINARGGKTMADAFRGRRARRTAEKLLRVMESFETRAPRPGQTRPENGTRDPRGPRVFRWSSVSAGDARRWGGSAPWGERKTLCFYRLECVGKRGHLLY